MGLIRWIADVTGVTKKIKEENTIDIGHKMYDYSYWFTGGLQVDGTKYDISNILAEYGTLLRKGRTHLIGEEHSNLRAKLYRLSEKNECVHK